MPSQLIRWGILGTGFISGEFAKGLKFVNNAQLFGVSSRKASNAQAFAQIFQVPRAYDSYEQLVRDPDIDVVYIGTPNHTHKDLCILCLEAGKPVLCEKPFTINAQEAREVIDLARRQKLFCMEAMWMRFMPLIQQVKIMVEQGKIGDVKMLTADFGYPLIDTNNAFSTPEFGGGVLLDRGVYGLSLAYYLLGEPSQILSQASICASGVDEQSSILLKYPQGKLAVLSQSLRTRTSNQAVIMGTTGKILIEELFIMPEKISVSQFSPSTQTFPSPLIALSSKQKLVAAAKQNSLIRGLYRSVSGLLKSERVIVKPLEGNGYNYEATEVINCLQNGQLESQIMPLDETLKIIAAIDRIRSQWSQ
ncbi:MAG TPA: Gfo/Idh/MocA family oxidoreductase [Coleofasciculaceae cyanobacterium]|jgi:predicted dehydrogenase